MGAMAPASLSSGFQSFTPIPTIKLGHSGAGSRVSGPVHTLGPCGFSPTTSPVRLGVSPAAAPTPRGTFNQRFEALFPPSWSPGLHGLLRCPPVRQVYLWANVVPQGATRHSACPTLRHSESGPLGLSVQMWGPMVC